MRAYLVLGSESSGTRLATAIMVQAGCLGGYDFVQEFDTSIPQSSDKHIVWRRSFPHGEDWPSVWDLVAAVQTKGYTPIPIVTTRNMIAAAKSKVKRTHSDSLLTAYDEIQKAYGLIFYSLRVLDLAFSIWDYESISSGRFIKEHLELLGLKPLTGEQIAWLGLYDGNEKWLSKRR